MHFINKELEAKRDEGYGYDYAAKKVVLLFSKYSAFFPQTTLHLPPLSIPSLIHLSSLKLLSSPASNTFQFEIAFRKEKYIGKTLPGS